MLIMPTYLTYLANRSDFVSGSAVLLSILTLHILMSPFLNELTNNLIIALDVRNPLVGHMILYIGNSSRVVIIEFHMVYNARNKIKLIDELSYPNSHFACLTSLHIGVSIIDNYNIQIHNILFCTTYMS
jgi:hypothetical protein